MGPAPYSACMGGKVTVCITVCDISSFGRDIHYECHSCNTNISKMCIKICHNAKFNSECYDIVLNSIKFI